MLRTIPAILLLFSGISVSASNLDYLHNVTPIADFTSEDTRMFEDAIEKALNEKKDNEKLAWKNDKTGNSGLVNPLSTYITNKIECRVVRIINKSKKNIAETKYKFCKKDNKWIAVELLK